MLATKDLTYQDLNDFYTSENKSFGIQYSTGNKTDQSENNKQPKGSTTISLTNTGEEKEQITKATIGNGTIIIGGNNIEDLKDGNGNNLYADLNRDVNNSQEITKDMITGALDGSFTIDNRLFTEEGRADIASDFKNLPENTLNVAQNLWDLPMTTVGLSYGLLNVVTGYLTNKPVMVQNGEKGIEFIGGRLGLGSNCIYKDCGSAITLGSVVNYFGNINPDSIVPNSIYTGLPIILGPHENTHIDQYRKYGPLFLPIYLINGGVSGSNKFEIEADKKGNEAYNNKYRK